MSDSGIVRNNYLPLTGGFPQGTHIMVIGTINHTESGLLQ